MVLFNTILFIDTNDVEQTGAKKNMQGLNLLLFVILKLLEIVCSISFISLPTRI